MILDFDPHLLERTFNVCRTQKGRRSRIETVAPEPLLKVVALRALEIPRRTPCSNNIPQRPKPGHRSAHSLQEAVEILEDLEREAQVRALARDPDSSQRLQHLEHHARIRFVCEDKHPWFAHLLCN